MRPVLYAADEAAFTSNGIGVLSDCVSCLVTEERNGAYELEMQYPVNGLWADEFEVGQVIKAQANDTDPPQLFQIYDVVRTLSGAFTVKAEHISYRLSGVPVSRITSQYGIANAISAITNNAVIPLGFTIDTNISSNEWFATTTPYSARSLIGGDKESLLATYGGELRFDNFKVHLLAARGANNGVTIRYGKNLTDVEQDMQDAAYNGVYAYWYKDGEGYVEASAPAVAPGTHPVKCYQTLDLTSEFNTVPTAAQLTTRAQQIANGYGSPLESIDVSFITLHQLQEYATIAALEHVSLCDFVTVIYPELGINARMKVVKTVYNTLTEFYESITVGTLKTTLADVIGHEGGGGVTINSYAGGTTYSLSINGTSVTLTGTDGSASTISLPSQYAGSPSTGGNANKTNSILFGTVDNTSTNKIFTATVAGLTSLEDGTAVMLKNGVVTSASGWTLNINGLGDLPVYTNLAAATRDTTIFNINYTMLFIYDSSRDGGPAWICFRGYDSNNNTIGYQLRTNNSTMPASDKFYRYRLLFESADGTKLVPANTSTSTNATASRTTNARAINPFGRIYYYSTTAIISAGGMPAAGYLWTQYNITLGYSFNATGSALTLTENTPVYLRCTPQSDGSAVMDYFTQSLPATADGYIYIFLGTASAATTMELSELHPVYYHDGERVRLWTDAGPLTGNTNTITPAQVKAAVLSGRNICIATTGALGGLLTDFYFTDFNSAVDMNSGSTLDIVTATSAIYYSGDYYLLELQGDVTAATWQLNSTTI